MAIFTLDISDEIDRSLTEIARRNHLSKAQAIHRAFALLALADREKSKPGFSLGVVREREDHSLEAVGRVTGL